MRTVLGLHSIASEPPAECSLLSHKLAQKTKPSPPLLANVRWHARCTVCRASSCTLSAHTFFFQEDLLWIKINPNGTRPGAHVTGPRPFMTPPSHLSKLLDFGHQPLVLFLHLFELRKTQSQTKGRVIKATQVPGSAQQPCSQPPAQDYRAQGWSRIARSIRSHENVAILPMLSDLQRKVCISPVRSRKDL